MAKVLSERQRKMNLQLTAILAQREITEERIREQINPLLDDNVRSH